MSVAYLVTRNGAPHRIFTDREYANERFIELCDKHQGPAWRMFPVQIDTTVLDKTPAKFHGTNGFAT